MEKSKLVSTSIAELFIFLTVVFVLAKIFGYLEWAWWLVFLPSILMFVWFSLMGVGTIANAMLYNYIWAVISNYAQEAEKRNVKQKE